MNSAAAHALADRRRPFTWRVPAGASPSLTVDRGLDFPAGIDGQGESLREPAGVGEVGSEVKGLLGGAEGVGRLVVGLQGQGEVVVNVRPVGKPVDGCAEIVDRLREMPEREMSAAAEIAGLAIFRCQLDDLVQSRQRLIRLVSRQLDGRDVQADLGVVRFEFQGAEVLRQRLVGFSL